MKAGITFWKLPVGCFQWWWWRASLKSVQLNWVSHHVRNSKKLSKLTYTGFIFQESQSLHTTVAELNNTLVAYQKLNDIKLLNVDTAISNLSQRVMLLENSPLAVNNLDKRENLSTSVVSIGWLRVPALAYSSILSICYKYSFLNLTTENVRMKLKSLGIKFKRLESVLSF